MPPKRKEVTEEVKESTAELRKSGRAKNGPTPVYTDPVKPRTKKAKTDDAAEGSDKDELEAAEEEKPAEPAQAEQPEAGPSDIRTVGDKISADIQVVTDDGKDVKLGELYGEKGLVALLYPKANTPGCTTQACAFRDENAAFEEAGFLVYGLSMDGPKALKNWKDKHSFKYTLLSDPKQTLIKALGGSKSAKSVSRSHFVLGKDGKLLLASIGVKPAESSKAALAFVKALE